MEAVNVSAATRHRAISPVSQRSTRLPIFRLSFYIHQMLRRPRKEGQIQERILPERSFIKISSISRSKDDLGWYHSWPRSQVEVEIHDPLALHLQLLHKYSEADVHNVFAFLETLK